MHRLKVMLAFLLFAFGGVSLASAAGVGTFSIEQTTAGVGVGQFGIATLYMDNTWDPQADSAILTASWDPTVLQYISTDWKVGNSVAATPVGNNQLALSYADWTNKYPTGRVAIADLNFRGVAAGQSTMSIAITSVRSHEGVSATDFVELTASSLSNPGIFTVGQGGGTVVPTVPVGTTLPITPTLTPGPDVTGTVAPTLTTIPIVTGDVTGVITTPLTIFTTLPTTGPTGITTGVPVVPVQGSSGGSEDYTGVLTRTPTVPATRTVTVTGTATPTANATPTGGTGAGQTIVQVAQANPNLSTLVTAVQAAGLVGVLNGPGPFTVFAPTNAAFDKLPPGTLQGLLANKTELTRVLTYHVAMGRFASDNLTATNVIKTVEGQNVNVTVEAGRVRVDGAMVTQADIQASNGVIHVIDAVMIPPTGTTTPTANMTATAMTTAITGTTTVRTTVPVNTTATAAGFDVLPLAAAGLAALALIAARRR